MFKVLRFWLRAARCLSFYEHPKTYPETGVVDWSLSFPDGSVGIAQSRVTETTRGTSIYSFVLHAPPVALEHVEGALEAQRAQLRSELATLKSCGLASDTTICGCHRRVPAALRLGRVNPEAVDFAQRPSSFREIRAVVRQAEQARWALQVHRANDPRPSTVDFARRIAQTFDSRLDPERP
jgi:hypothetical protein